jgi:hypothetical protein
MERVIVDNEEVIAEYYLSFSPQSPTPDDPGYGFHCDKDGVVDVASLKPMAAENYRKCITGEYKMHPPKVEKFTRTIPLCPCGSGKYPEDMYDGHGIYLGRTCEQCQKSFTGKFRDDIFGDYDADEQIES